MLGDGRKLMAYLFSGYWKDVGTIDSLWEANMDLLNKDSKLNLDDDNWKIYTEDVTALPQFIGPDATVDVAYITQGCHIEGEAHHSVLFTNSVIHKNAVVKDTVLMNEAVIGEGASVTRALVSDGVKIGEGAVVGSPDSPHILLVAHDVPAGTVVKEEE
jgi:glucose-1-phosphate adenylyltransferase